MKAPYNTFMPQSASVLRHKCIYIFFLYINRPVSIIYVHHYTASLSECRYLGCVFCNLMYRCTEDRTKVSLSKKYNIYKMRVIGQNVLMANPSQQTFCPFYVSHSKQWHHPRLINSFLSGFYHSFFDI